MQRQAVKFQKESPGLHLKSSGLQTRTKCQKRYKRKNEISSAQATAPLSSSSLWDVGQNYCSHLKSSFYPACNGSPKPISWPIRTTSLSGGDHRCRGPEAMSTNHVTLADFLPSKQSIQYDITPTPYTFGIQLVTLWEHGTTTQVTLVPECLAIEGKS